MGAVVLRRQAGCEHSLAFAARARYHQIHPVKVFADGGSAIDEAAAMIGALGAARWGRPCEAEGWPVAVTALHIALGLRRQASFIALARDGQAAFTFDWEATHALNARVAARGVPARETVGR